MTITELDLEKINHFFTKYSQETILNCSNYTARTHLGDPKDDCRFCGVTKLTGKFETDAHIIPELLGNRFLLSHSECDTCNKIFSKYDDSLGKFLGLYRTASLTRGKKKIPKFKDELSGLQAKAESDGMLNIIVPSPSEIERSLKAMELTIKGKNQPHIPIQTFKALLKIAVSIVLPNQISGFSQAIKFLLNEIKVMNIQETELFKCCIDFLPHPMTVHSPVAILYRRIDPNEFIPAYIFQLLFKQLSLQILAPFHIEDEHIYATKHKGTIPFAPIVVPLEVSSNFGSSLRKIENFNSEDRSIFNEMSLTIKFNSIEKKTNKI